MTNHFDAYAASRPKPTLKFFDTFGRICLAFRAMEYRDREGETNQRDAIGAHIAHLAGGDTPANPR